MVRFKPKGERPLVSAAWAFRRDTVTRLRFLARYMAVAALLHVASDVEPRWAAALGRLLVLLVSAVLFQRRFWLSLRLPPAAGAARGLARWTSGS